MAKAIAKVCMGVDMEDIARRIMRLRGMHRRATWSANASPAVRDTIMGIGDMDVGTVMVMAITSTAATVTDMAIATNETKVYEKAQRRTVRLFNIVPDDYSFKT